MRHIQQASAGSQLSKMSHKFSSKCWRLKIAFTHSSILRLSKWPKIPQSTIFWFSRFVHQISAGLVMHTMQEVPFTKLFTMNERNHLWKSNAKKHWQPWLERRRRRSKREKDEVQKELKKERWCMNRGWEQQGAGGEVKTASQMRRNDSAHSNRLCYE